MASSSPADKDTEDSHMWTEEEDAVIELHLTARMTFRSIASKLGLPIHWVANRYAVLMATQEHVPEQSDDGEETETDSSVAPKWTEPEEATPRLLHTTRAANALKYMIRHGLAILRDPNQEEEDEVGEPDDKENN